MKTYGKVEVQLHILRVRRRRVIFTLKMRYTQGKSFRYPTLESRSVHCGVDSCPCREWNPDSPV
jgi:hypothetical protein